MEVRFTQFVMTAIFQQNVSLFGVATRVGRAGIFSNLLLQFY